MKRFLIPVALLLVAGCTPGRSRASRPLPPSDRGFASEESLGCARLFLEQRGYVGFSDGIEVERIITPDDWAATFNLARGSAFGLAQNFFQIGPFRPANQDARVRNLFFVGASTQPGTGLPTVLISARLTVERILEWSGVASAVNTPEAAGRGAIEEAA